MDDVMHRRVQIELTAEEWRAIVLAVDWASFLRPEESQNAYVQGQKNLMNRAQAAISDQVNAVIFAEKREQAKRREH